MLRVTSEGWQTMNPIENPRSKLVLLMTSVALISLGAASCREPVQQSSKTPTSLAPHSEGKDGKDPHGLKAIPKAGPIPDGLGDKDRWLRVEKTRNQKPGGWATGDFDKKRNRITIKTHEVTHFSIDMSKVPINWHRKVILKIDGISSEMRKRDFNVYHFANDKHGRWQVKGS